jgi:glutamyl-tRNA synthetase
VLLYKAFGWEMPAFIHMPLLRNKDKSKISKRRDPTSLIWYRRQGYLPEAMLNFLALMGWSMTGAEQVFSLAEMIENFSWDRVKTSGPVFDLQKLEWLNGHYIRQLMPEALLERLLQGGYTAHAGEPADRLLAITRLVQERIKMLSQFDEMTGFFFATEPYEATELTPKKAEQGFTRDVLRALEDVLRGVEEWRAEPLEEAVSRLCEEKGWRRGAAYMPLRVAVTCRRVSTPLFETMEILGKEECMRRLKTAVQKARALP